MQKMNLWYIKSVRYANRRKEEIEPQYLATMKHDLVEIQQLINKKEPEDYYVDITEATYLGLINVSEEEL